MQQHSFLDLPNELLRFVLDDLTPMDAACLALTCKSLAIRVPKSRLCLSDRKCPALTEWYKEKEIVATSTVQEIASAVGEDLLGRLTVKNV